MSKPPKPSYRNPKWTRDELILALDLYLQTRPKPPGKGSREIAALSATLNELGKTLGNVRSAKFRNLNGTAMKLMNFRRFDPDYKGVGLQRGGAEEAVVWREFASDPKRCHAVAEAITRGIPAPEAHFPVDLEDEDLEAEEGRILTRLHRTRERNRKLVAARKASFLKLHGRLYCEACGFDFHKTYGEQGRGVIDAHHTRPLHTLIPGTKTRPEDLTLLCANCHRIIHAARPWLTIERLRGVLLLEC